MYRASKSTGSDYAITKIQRAALTGLATLVTITFLGTNLQAVLWQHSNWLVSTVLPAVVVDLTNDERATLDEAPLRRSAVLDAAAQMKANDMAKNEYFAHYSPDGISPWYWFKQAGYTYAHAGENLAIHFTDSSEVVEAWMNSPTHRENIVNSLYTEIGVGTAKGTYEGYDTVYVVQLFGAPAAVPATVAALEPSATPAIIPTPAPRPVANPQVAGVEEVIPATEPVTNHTQPATVAKNQPTAVTPVKESETRTIAAVPAPVTVPLELQTEVFDDTVVVTQPLMATSSGLAIASVDEPYTSHAGATALSMATQPHRALQTMYILVALLTLSLITWSLVHEARRLHFVQVAYSIALLAAVGGLWYVHGLLTAGAVVI
ncbi:hypothetical protein KC887_00170 [Candidatus Kaiserbacteria bacterium]|nr:hypothetical protein [Candidatus Kaiserbacteria bacterium]